MRFVVVVTLAITLVSQSFAGDKYPLTMTAEYIEGKPVSEHRDRTYHVGDYDCTAGDEHNAPTCHTTLEWAQLDAIGGTPNTVVFTMADGVRVGVQSGTVKKIPDYIECGAGTPIIFCHLLFDLYDRANVNTVKTGRYGQYESMTAEEYTAASEARRHELFGDKNVMTVRYRYRLKGKTDRDGFQRIEVDPRSCDANVRSVANECKQAALHFLNPHGDGYYKR